MKINNEVFNNISDMVKLSFTEEEKSRLIKDLNQLVEFIDSMNDMNTDKVEAMTHIHSESNIYRDDLEDNYEEDEILHANAPDSRNGYYVVPRILD